MMNELQEKTVRTVTAVSVKDKEKKNDGEGSGAGGEMDSASKIFIGIAKDEFWVKQYKLFFEKSKIEINSDNPIELGVGGFGKVFVGQKDKKNYAVKFIKLRNLDDIDENKYKKLYVMAKNEMIVSINFKHKNIIICFGVFELENFSRAIVL